MGSVSPDALARLAAMRRPEETRAGGTGWTYDAAATLDAVTADLAALNIRTTDKPPKPQPDGGRLWELTGCPYSDDHDDSAFLVQYGDGGVHVGCHHDRCEGKTIQKNAPDRFPKTVAVKATPPPGPRLTFGGRPVQAATGSDGSAGATGAGTAGDDAPDRPPLRLLTRRASEIDPKEIDWLWPQWLPAGMVALLAGYGGSGKSTAGLSIAAAGSNGGKLPDGTTAPVFNTLVFAAEDSPEHTTIPRLMAMRADLDRIHIVDGVARDDDEPGWVTLRAHLPAIEAALIQYAIRLVIIDPVSSFIGDANGDKESDVRAGIMPVVAMAERTGAAVLMIRHVSKAGDGMRAASRILGSTAWHDVPRVAWMLADAPEEHQPEPGEDGIRDTRRVLGVVKSNLAAKPRARWCYQPMDGALKWFPEPAPVTIDECFYQPTERATPRQDAAESYLRDLLKGGGKPATEVYASTDIGEKTLRAALFRMGGTIKRDGFQGPMIWRLPLENHDTNPPNDGNGGNHGNHASAENASVYGAESNDGPIDGIHSRLPSLPSMDSLDDKASRKVTPLRPTGTDGPRPGEVEV